MKMLDLWLEILLPICSIAVPVFATIYTVNKRIKSQTKENHQPHLVLDSVASIDKINKYKYYYTLIGRNYQNENSNSSNEIIKDNNIINVKLIIRNIGYGVASNIKLYNLLTGKNVKGDQSTKEDINQKLFTTLDIAALDEKELQAQIINKVIVTEEEITEDHIRILCVYKDLHNNIFDFIISINVKKTGKYNFFAYQPTSSSYKR